MPNVQLRQRRDFGAPNLQGGRKGTSVAEGLAKSLGLIEDAVTGPGMQVFKAKEAEAIELEKERIDGLLSSPTLTPEEAAEISGSTKFLSNQTRALNRQGEVTAELQYDRIVEEVGKTKSVTDARQRLRELQQELVGGVSDPAVIAGINERFASYAPNLLQQASARRQGQRDAREAGDISADFSASLESRGGQGFLSSFRGALADDILTKGGDGKEVHAIAVDTLKNRWLAGEEIGGELNPNADDVLEAIGVVLAAESTRDSAQRSKYLSLRKSIITRREENLSARDRTSPDDATFNTLFTAASQKLVAGETVSAEAVDALYAAAAGVGHTEVSKVNSLLSKETGLSYTSEAKNGRNIINSMFQKSVSGQIVFLTPRKRQAAMTYYEDLLRQVEGVDDPADRSRLTSQFAQEALEFADTLTGAPEGEEAKNEDLKVSSVKAREDFFAAQGSDIMFDEFTEDFLSTIGQDAAADFIMMGGAQRRFVEAREKTIEAERRALQDDIAAAIEAAGINPANITLPR